MCYLVLAVELIYCFGSGLSLSYISLVYHVLMVCSQQEFYLTLTDVTFSLYLVCVLCECGSQTMVGHTVC